jgi:amidase
MPGYAEVFEYNSRVLWYEFEPSLNAYLQKTAPHIPVKSLADVIAYNAANAREQLLLGQAIMEAAFRYSASLTEKEYIQHRLRDCRTTRNDGIDHALKEYNVVALVFPGNSAAIIGARAGYPTLSVPAGYLANGQPYGVTFAGTAFTEGILIGLAYAFEQGFTHRVWPDLN